jgi:hypothetical protein
MMLKDLIKVATRLDALGLTKEADVVDALIRKIAETGDDEFYTMWNSLSDEEKDKLEFKTRKFLSYYNSFCEDPESDLGRWDESLYLEYVGEEGYPTPTEERKEEILKEVKRNVKGSLLRSEKIDIEESAIAKVREMKGDMGQSDFWRMPPHHRNRNY